ncbi:DUF975 family protein [Fibrobacter sp. UWB11]|uniref:DUF975 family protein n=1 Tax=Fibrobacter sp. UWB11 TaxID=1896202 RepID=UPI0009299B8E|nr:DUF975 family protein [Fibrobacter sp. UWB11]SIN86577.1 Uncharacterized membrane protein [Fibrobacter sp. UWB11]
MNALDTEQIKQTAWKKLSGKWTQACLGFLLFFIISIALDLPSLFFEDGTVGQALYNGIWGPIEWALTWVLDIGILAFYYDIVCNRPLYYKRIFSGFTHGFIYAVNAFCTQLLMSIFVVLWAFLLIIPGIMRAFSYSMSLYILIDHPEYSPLEAIKKSKEMMYGHRMELFILELRFIPWLLLSLITLGIALIWVVPYMSTACCEFYLQLKEKTEQQVPNEPEVIEATEA